MNVVKGEKQRVYLKNFEFFQWWIQSLEKYIVPESNHGEISPTMIREIKTKHDLENKKNRPSQTNSTKVADQNFFSLAFLLPRNILPVWFCNCKRCLWEWWILSIRLGNGLLTWITRSGKPGCSVERVCLLEGTLITRNESKTPFKESNWRENKEKKSMVSDVW